MKHDFRRIYDQAGYNLLQMCIAMLVLGVLCLPFISMYNQYQQQKKVITSQEHLLTVVNAIQSYRKTYGSYPCPAPLFINRTDTAYGHEIGFPTPNSCKAAMTGTTPGTCGSTTATGACIKTEADAARSTALGVTKSRVITGGIPFRLLQLNEMDTVDGYGSKYVYSVTESMTDPNTYDDKGGAISVQDSVSNSLVDPPGSAAFAVVSPGQDQVGGVTIYGQIPEPCTGAGLDRDNCNMTSTGSIIRALYPNKAAGTNHYDDYASYYSSLSDPLWKRIGTTADIQDLSERNIGVGTTPASAVQLDISGSGSTNAIRLYGSNSNDGTVYTDKVCDKDGANCFDTKSIAEDDVTGAGMKCPTGQYATAIKGGGLACETISTLKVSCGGSTPYLVGVDSSGNVQCAGTPKPTCPSLTVSLCATNDATIVGPVANGSTKTATAGACRSQNYKCSGTTNPKLTASGSATGRCAFTPGAPTGATTNASCSGTYGPMYAGTFTTSTVAPTACTAADVTIDTHTTDCRCIDYTTTASQTCSSYYGSSYYSGNVTRTTTYVASAWKSPCASTTSAWDTSQCKCVAPSPNTRNTSAGSCATNYTGSITQPQIFDTATCAWKNNGAVVNTCSCNTSATQTRSQDHTCPDVAGAANACDIPDPSQKDIFTQTVDPSTCKFKPEVQTQVGKCKTPSYKWVNTDGSNGEHAASKGANLVGAACGCSEHLKTSAQPCFNANDSTNQVYFCRCQ